LGDLVRVIRLLVGIVDFSRRYAWGVLAAALALSVAAGIYAAGTLGITTDTSKLLSPDLPWQKAAAAFDQAFPQGVAQLAIVIDGDTADATDDAAAALADALAKRPDLFRTVERPEANAFFKRYGLLLLSTEELGKLSDQLAQAQPLLGPLDADPSLRGLFGVLGMALGGVEQGQAPADMLTGPMTRFAGAVESLNAGAAKPVSWQALMTARAPQPEELRRFVLVQPKLDFTALEPGGAARSAVRDLVTRLPETSPASGIRVRMTGEVALNDEEFASVTQGAGIATALSLVAVCVLLLLGLRSPRIIVAIFITLIVGLVMTAGFATLAVGTLNLISVAFAVLFIGIGVDFGIQFAMRYRAELHTVTGGARPADPHAVNIAALRRTAEGVGGPLALAAVAAAVGFFSFLPTDYRGVSELGLIAGTGMGVALLANLTVLPALLTLIPGRGVSEAAGFAWAAGVDRWLARRHRWVAGAALVLGIAAAATVPFLTFDADPMDLKDPTKESVRTAIALIDDPNTSPYTIEVLNPDLPHAVDLAGHLDKLSQVKMTLTLQSFVPGDQPAKLDILDGVRLFLGPILDHADPAPLPGEEVERQSAEAFIATLKRLAGLPAAGDLAPIAKRLDSALTAYLARPNVTMAPLRNVLVGGFERRMDALRLSMTAGPVTADTMPAEFRAQWIAADGRARVEVFPKGNIRDQRVMHGFVDAVVAVAPTATGAPVAILASGDTISHAFLQASLLALVAITLVLAIILRRLRDVALVLIPLLLAGLYAIGTCVAIGLPLNFANVIAVPLLLGIGVAFDIYFVMAWRRGSGPVALLQTSTARAVVFSAFTTTTAFGSLALSHHAGTASMGLLLMIALGYALLCTLVVQPALMSLWGRGAGAGESVGGRLAGIR